MRGERRHRAWATLGGMFLIMSTVTWGASATALAALGSFGPPSNVWTEVSPNIGRYPFRRIGIIAFVNHSTTPDAGARLARFFHTELEAQRQFEVMPPLLLDEEAELAFTRTAQTAPEEERPSRLRQFVREWIGRIWPSSQQPPEEGQGATSNRENANARSAKPLDAVLTGIVTRYDDRQGNAFLADQPASVAYEAYLISTQDGEILWHASFDETQKPLLDNLLLVGRFLRGGGGWQTNDTLARIGLERVVKTFPGIAGTP